MTSELINEDAIKTTIQQASCILGYDLNEILTEDYENKLKNTEVAQPAILASSYALWKLYKEKKNIKPKIMAGHSLGEYSALVCSGAISFEDTLKLVEKRGKIMKKYSSADRHKMVAILGINLETVEKICRTASRYGVVDVANINNNSQIVIAGEKEAVQRACLIAKNINAKKTVELNIEVASHSQVMKDAAIELEEEINRVEINYTNIPVIHNFNAKAAKNTEEIKRNLVKQLHNPVKWMETVQNINNNTNINQIIECSSSTVLTKINQKITRSIQHSSIMDQLKTRLQHHDRLIKPNGYNNRSKQRHRACNSKILYGLRSKCNRHSN